MSKLLNESWLEQLPDNVVKNMELLNDYVVQKIAEQIRAIGDIGAANAYRLKSAIEYAGADLDEIQKEIARTAGRNEREIEEIFEQIAEENVDFANTYYKARGMKPLKKYTESAILQSFVDAWKASASDGVTNVSKTTAVGFKSGRRVIPLREYYIQTIDRAVTFAQTGAIDYQTAMRQTVKEMARSGLRRVSFESGHSRRLDSQARMNILDGVRGLSAQMMEQAGKEFGADGVEISAHGLCAPDHQPIQGRQFSMTEYEQLNARLERPIGTMNCRHRATPIVLGVSMPVYSASELREINRRSNEKVSFKTKDRKGKEVTERYTRYDASQRQRQYETALRYAGDELDALQASGDQMGAAQAKKKVKALRAEYKNFCYQTGLTPRPERTRSMTGGTMVKA